MSTCDLASECKLLHITTEEQQLPLLKNMTQTTRGFLHVEGGGLGTWESPQHVQVRGRTTHSDRVSDIACSTVEQLHRESRHGNCVSDTS